jgi:hypothetical protein
LPDDLTFAPDVYATRVSHRIPLTLATHPPPSSFQPSTVGRLASAHSLTVRVCGYVLRSTSEFIPKLVRFRARQAAASAPLPLPDATAAAAAAALGLPQSFHVRYKSNNAIMLDVAAAADLHKELLNEYRLMLVEPFHAGLGLVGGQGGYFPRRLR